MRDKHGTEIRVGDTVMAPFTIDMIGADDTLLYLRGVAGPVDASSVEALPRYTSGGTATGGQQAPQKA